MPIKISPKMSHETKCGADTIDLRINKGIASVEKVTTTNCDIEITATDLSNTDVKQNHRTPESSVLEIGKYQGGVFIKVPKYRCSSACETDDSNVLGTSPETVTENVAPLDLSAIVRPPSSTAEHSPLNSDVDPTIDPDNDSQILVLNGKEYEIIPLGDGRWISRNEYDLLQGLNNPEKDFTGRCTEAKKFDIITNDVHSTEHQKFIQDGEDVLDFSLSSSNRRRTDSTQAEDRIVSDPSQDSEKAACRRKTLGKRELFVGKTRSDLPDVVLLEKVLDLKSGAPI